MELAAVVALAAVLVVAWTAANQRHLQRRAPQAADWGPETEQRPDLWTSSATCVHCGAAGGLLELRDDDVHFTCLACGAGHVRETRA